MNHLPAFTIHDLARIVDWLDEAGELYVDVYLPTGAGGTFEYLIRSIHDLKLIAQEQNFWGRRVFTIYREIHLPLRGTANAQLLEQALEQFTEGHVFYAMHLAYYPDECYCVAQRSSHMDLVQVFAQEWGHSIALGQPLTEDDDLIDIFSPRHDTEELDLYEPYLANPARYQWIIDMWRES